MSLIYLKCGGYMTSCSAAECHHRSSRERMLQAKITLCTEGLLSQICLLAHSRGRPKSYLNARKSSSLALSPCVYCLILGLREDPGMHHQVPLQDKHTSQRQGV